METIFKCLQELKFPIFPIGNGQVYRRDGRLVFQPQHTDVELVIDDSNLSSPSFGVRRLQITEKLYKLKKAIYTLRDLIKFSSSHSSRLYVDYSGKIIKYSKRNIYNLEYFKIQNYKKYPDATILFLEGVHCPIKSDRPPFPEESYVGLLKIGKGYMLYDFATYKLPNTVRKI